MNTWHVKLGVHLCKSFLTYEILGQKVHVYGAIDYLHQQTSSPHYSNLIEDRLRVMTFEKNHITDNYSNDKTRQMALMNLNMLIMQLRTRAAGGPKNF